ncbi:MAG: efflux transporter outer membrane subunit [Caulobacteraceae bacterium]
MTHALRPVLFAAAAAAALAGCAVGPDYRRPELGLNHAFHTAAPAAAAAPATDMTRWWDSFGDPALTRVVERAEAQNLDLAQARARVLQSRAAAKAAGAALLPTASAQAGITDVQQSLLSPIGAVARGLPGFERDYDDYDLGASASWEIDLFGGLRRGREAARADAAASRDLADAVRVSVAAEAADAYLQVRAYQARLDAARGQERVDQDLVGLVSRRADEGVSSERELHQAQAELEAVRATAPPLLSGLAAELNRLDVLMGAQPGTYQAELLAAAPIPAAPAVAGADGPAGLLRRRPDVAAAEQRLIAANARIGEAVADYYPKVSISGLLGVESLDSSQVFAGEAVSHQIGAGLRWRLFDFGRVDAEVAGARGRDAEALAAWRAAVLGAAEEVEDAFADLGQQQARADALSRQIEALTLARAQAEQAYENGAISLIEVRDADRQLLSASDQLAQARAGAARAAVACFRALGGGWKAPPAPLRVARS